MITNTAIRKELKNEKTKIYAMALPDVIKYMKSLMLQMARLINKENVLLRKKKYKDIKEESAWAKVKLSNILSYCASFIFKPEHIESHKQELLTIQKNFDQLMLAMQENKLHIMRVANLQQIASQVGTENLIEEANKTFGYDTKAQYISLNDPLRYSRPISTNQYT